MMMMIFFFLIFVLIITTTAQLSDTQKKLILEAFNTARATTVLPAANMRILKWDDDIAAEMQAYTDQCDDYWSWQEFRDPPAYFLYRDKAADPVGVARWRTLRMAPYYDYYTGGCIDTPQSKKICRHPSIYGAVVFAGNERIGCGTTRCGPGPKGVHHACAVAPTFDYEYDISLYAWIIGTPCSKCPPGFDYCVRDLCSREPGPPPSATPTRSPKASSPTRSPKFTAPTRSPKSKSPTPRYTGPTKSPRYSTPSRSPIVSRPTKSPIILPTKAPVTQRPTTSPIILPTKAPVTQRPTRSPSKYRPSISPSVSSSPTPPTSRKSRKKRKGL